MNNTNNTSKTVHHIATECLSVRLRLLNRLVNTIYDRALQPYNIKASQLNILVAVAFSGKTTSKELCNVLQMDKSTFSRTLTRLNKNNWLTAEPSGEGKILNVAITSIGLAKIGEVYEPWQNAQEEVSKLIGDSASTTILSTGSKFLRG